MLRQQKFVHHCELKQTEDVRIPRVSPYASRLTKMLYAWREFTSISDRHGDCKLYFRSRASIVKEKIRHFKEKSFRFSIHPLSEFVTVRKTIMAFYWLFIFFYDPVAGSFLAEDLFDPDTDSIGHDVFLVSSNLLLFIDVVVNFFTGYIVEQTREIVLARSKVMRNYIFTYFVFDIIPIFSVVCLQIFRYIPMHIQLVMFQLHFLRTVRLRSMVDYFEVIFKAMNIKESCRVCLHLGLIAIIVVHWWACILGIIPLIKFKTNQPLVNSWVNLVSLGNHDKVFGNLKTPDFEKVVHKTYLKTKDTSRLYNHKFHSYMEFLTMAMCHFYGAGTGDFHTHDEYEMFALAIMLMTGVVFYLYALATILQLFGTVNISETKYDELFSQVVDYMETKKFPEDLQKRIGVYYTTRFDGKFFREKQILNTLSEHLRMELLLNSCSNLIQTVDLFKGLSKAAVGSIVGVLKQEIYLPKDAILTHVDTTDTIYFILYGTIGVFVKNGGAEVKHLEDGRHFGDLNKILRDSGQEFLWNYVALEVAQIYYLTYADLRFCCALYPEIWNRFSHMCQQRLRYYVGCLEHQVQRKSDKAGADDVLTKSLRKGLVLGQDQRLR